MARTSRKAAIHDLRTETAAPLPAPQSAAPVWDTAAYARLSVLETRDRKDSEALENQKKLLLEFLQSRPELRLCGLYADNGETGTNFDRDQFQRMMADVRAGKINCIVVKDLSRFGRDYVEAGEYLEHVFPLMGVRFISLNDNYDSNHALAGDALKVALKNLVNQMYSMDISRKSGSVLRDKQRRGEFIGAYASYGYLRDPSDVHRMIVDPEAATIVGEIFRRRANGESDLSITRWLNSSEILSPCTYRYQKGIVLDKRFAEGGKPWMICAVKAILKNPVYLGHTVQGRRRSEFYAGLPDRRVDPSEWVVVENTHEAIIDREIFDRVQESRQHSGEIYRARLGKYDHLGIKENLFTGLVYCADCGRPMVRYKQVTRGKRVEYRFICPNYSEQLAASGCTYKYLLEDGLEDALCRLIAQEMRLAVDATALLRKLEGRKPPEAVWLEAELERAETALSRLSGLRERLMRDFLSGVLSEADYRRLKVKYEREDRELQEHLNGLQAEQRRQSELLTARNPWAAAFQSVGNKLELTPALVRTLVERITVHAENRIEIQFKFTDERATLLDFLAERKGAIA